MSEQYADLGSSRPNCDWTHIAREIITLARNEEGEILRAGGAQWPERRPQLLSGLPSPREAESRFLMP
jgi:hypothetical protein